MTGTKHLLLGISIGIIIVIVAVSVRSCCAATPDMDKIRFTDLPRTIDMKPGSQASFDVTLENFGNQYARRVHKCQIVAGCANDRERR
jgi:hypothetical protein